MPSSPVSNPPAIPIYTVRGQRVVLDSDLATIYGVSTTRFNQAVKRNLRRFPEDFAFVLTREEFEALMSQIVTSSSESRPAPSCFTMFN